MQILHDKVSWRQIFYGEMIWFGKRKGNALLLVLGTGGIVKEEEEEEEAPLLLLIIVMMSK